MTETRIYPALPPRTVANHGDLAWAEVGTKYQGYWEYHRKWGWSNFVAANPELFMPPEKSRAHFEMYPNSAGVGVLANGG